jgi:hypothetical protein
MFQKHILKCLAGAFILLLWPNDASAACLSPSTDQAQLSSAAQRSAPQQVLVADADAAALEAKGFTPAPCSGELADQAVQSRYRDTLCGLVAASNEATQKQMERALGAAPALLCASAEKLVGPWNGGWSAEPVTESREITKVIDGESEPVEVETAQGDGDAK